MDVYGLDGKSYRLKLTGKRPLNNATRPRSSGHKLCRELLIELFPVSMILEEVTLLGTNNLKADFFLPHERLVIEVCGKQHYEYTPFFHGDKASFYRAKVNDENKKEWCLINNFKLIELPDTQTLEEWKEIIINA